MKSLDEIRTNIQNQGLDKSLFKPKDSFGYLLFLKLMLFFWAYLAFFPHLINDFNLKLPAQIGIVVLSVFIIGTLAYKFTFVLHETCHYSLFDSKKKNEFYGSIAGFITGTDYYIFKAIHMLHHKKNGQELDPQLPDYLGQYNGMIEEPLKGPRIFSHLVAPLFGSRLISFTSHYFARFLPRKLAEDQIYKDEFEMPSSSIWFFINTLLTQILVATLVTDFFKYPLYALLYPVSAITISLFLARYRAAAEHMRPNRITDRNFTRSHAPNFFETLFLYDANFNFHLEHHAYPQLPACNLPEFNSKYFDAIHDKDSYAKSSMTGTLIKMIQNPN